MTEDGPSNHGGGVKDNEKYRRRRGTKRSCLGYEVRCRRRGTGRGKRRTRRLWDTGAPSVHAQRCTYDTNVTNSRPRQRPNHAYLLLETKSGLCLTTNTCFFAFKDFITNSIEASKKLQYPPATYLDKPISIDNYFITYRFEPAGKNDQIPLFDDNFKSRELAT